MALKEQMYVSTNTTIMRSNLDDLEATMRFLITLGVKNIAFNGIIRSATGSQLRGHNLSRAGPCFDQTQADQPRKAR